MKQAIINAVRAHAVDNYTTGGWDIVVECYSDADILEYTAGATTPAEAIAKMGAYIADIHEYRQEIGSTFF